MYFNIRITNDMAITKPDTKARNKYRKNARKSDKIINNEPKNLKQQDVKKMIQRHQLNYNICQDP